jgi:putative MATE family efflux protein
MKQNENSITHRMGQGSVLKVLLSMAIPGMVSMLVNALYNIVDRIFVGRGVGPLGLAAVGISFPVTLIVMAFATGISVGGASLISRRIGEHKLHEASEIMNQSLGLLAIIALIFTAAGLTFLGPLSRLLGASDLLMPYTTSYLRIILLGTLFQCIGVALGEMLRSMGRATASMTIMLTGAVANIILDTLFIFVLKQGMAGAATATVISQLLVVITGFLLLKSPKSIIHFHIRETRPHWQVTRYVIAIGASAFVLQFANALQNTVMNGQLVKYGAQSPYGSELTVGAMSLVITISMLAVSLAIGVGFGARPLMAYNYGARNYRRLKYVLLWANILNFIFLGTGTLIFNLFPEVILGLFTDSSEASEKLIMLGASMLTRFTVILPFNAVAPLVSFYYQATGSPLKAIFASMLKQVILLVPALYILPLFMGLDGVIWAGPTADALTVIIALAMLIYEMHKLTRIGKKYGVTETQI